MRRLVAILLVLAACAASLPLIAQENAEGDKGFFLRFVEEQLSAPGRQIAISGIDGVLSSDVTIPEITISDSEGVWLRITNAVLNWDQGALLGGRLQINKLSADEIDYIRPAVPATGIDLPPPEASAPEIPQLPIAIVMNELSVPSVKFGAGVFGLGSEISVAGNLTLMDGSLDTKLDIVRKDGPGGTLALALKYDRQTQNADIDLALAEPPDGMIVNLLGMDGKPDLSLSIKGSGPLASLKTDLGLDVGGKRALTGSAQLSKAADGLKVEANLGGPVADLVPSAYKTFFGDETRLSTQMLIRDAGGITVDTLTLKGGELALQASADTAKDGFLTRLKLDASIAGSGGARVLLPGGGAKTSVAGAHLTIDFAESADWTANLDVTGLETADLTAEALKLGVSGAALDLADPQKRRVTFNADGALSGIASGDPQLAAALGKSLGLGIAGLWSPEAGLQLAQMRASGKAFDLAMSGTLDNFAFDGSVAVRTPSIASFSGLAGRQLGGALDLKATGKLNFLSGGFDMALDGTADNLAFGIEPVDALLAGRTTIGGRLARNETGLSASGFAIGNANSRITADGSFASDTADFTFTAAVDDLSLVSGTASGALAVKGTAKGQGGNIALAFDAGVPAGTLSGRPLRDAKLAFGGTLNQGTLTGNLSGLAFLDGHRVDLTAGLASADGVSRLTGLKFETQGTVVTGDVTQDGDGFLTGKLDLKATDISLAAALMLTDAKGAATAAIELGADNGMQTAKIAATAQNLVIDQVRIASARIDAQIGDLFGVPAVDGTIEGTGLDVAGLSVSRLNATARRRGETTGFTAAATLDNGASLDAAGSLSPAGKGYRVVLDTARLEKGALTASLAGSTSATIADDVVILQSATFAVGNGRIVSSGTAGKTLDLSVDLTDVPLATANAIMPELGLAGTVNGRVRVTGAAADPAIAFKLTGRGIDATAIAEYGVTPLTISANGSYSGDVLRLDSLSADGASGAAFTASGALPMVGSGGDLRVRGQIPLAIANAMIGNRGTQLSGTATLDMRIGGSLAKPSYDGTVSTANAGIVDPLANLRLESISARARLSEDAVSIESFSGTLATGGTVGVSGTVSLAPEAGFPADLKISLNSARYADRNLFVATASGRLGLSGPLTRGPLLSGTVQLEKAEIAIPDSLDSGAGLLDVSHEAAPPGVLATLKRIAANTSGSGSGGPSGSLKLDVTINAPNQVFVRGRGVDAELGGEVRLKGPIEAIEPVGGFRLIRGRMMILGQRIEFTSGTVSLIGDLDPYIDLTAASPGNGITVYVTVRGPASALDIKFTSSPELPQDEVLSQLIFKRTLGDLSPLQIAKLAAAASELAGGGGNSLTDSLRSAAGLADLDIVTDAQGNTAVKAGTYLQDNVYVSVEAGTQGRSKVSIDLNLSDSVKASGSTTSDGESSIGIFYEQDF